MSGTLTGATFPPIRVVSAKLFVPWARVWYVDLDLDPDDVTKGPTSGTAVLTLGTAPGPVATLNGTVDPRGSGSFVATSKVRFVAGAGNWDKTVTARHFHVPSGVLSRDLYTQTALEVGESVNDPAPINLAQDVVRINSPTSPASDVFRERDWYVDFAAVTQVGSRPVGVLDPSFELLFYDPLEERGEFACDAILMPNTAITDARIPGGPITVRDVEQTFGPKSTRGTFWAGQGNVSRFKSAFTAQARQAVDYAHLRMYRYRYAVGPPGAMQLQAISAGAPDLNPIGQWTGLAGCSAKLGQCEMVVGFTADDPPQPFVIAYSPLGTVTEVDIGGGQHSLVIDEWASGLVGAGSPLAKLAAALTTAGVANTLAADLAAFALAQPRSTVIARGT
jgi:hypothetical protein